MSAYHITMSSKGQFVVPAELRERLGLEKGTRARLTEEEGRLVLTPLTKRRLREIRGFLKPAPGAPTMFDELIAERQRERLREKG
jgi:AbrB family looped-hinge helix DNA binding protein